MTINLQINKAKQNIVDVINNSNLPISIIRMIVDGIAEEVRGVERKTLEQELEEEKREQEEQEEQENAKDNTQENKVENNTAVE